MEIDLHRSRLLIADQTLFMELAPKRGARHPYVNHGLIEARLQQLDEIFPAIAMGLARAGMMVGRGAMAAGRGALAVGRGAMAAGRGAVTVGTKAVQGTAKAAQLGARGVKSGVQAAQKVGSAIKSGAQTAQKAGSAIKSGVERGTQAAQKAGSAIKTGVERGAQTAQKAGSAIKTGVERGAQTAQKVGDAAEKGVERAQGIRGAFDRAVNTTAGFRDASKEWTKRSAEKAKAFANSERGQKLQKWGTDKLQGFRDSSTGQKIEKKAKEYSQKLGLGGDETPDQTHKPSMAPALAAIGGAGLGAAAAGAGSTPRAQQGGQEPETPSGPPTQRKLVGDERAGSTPTPAPPQVERPTSDSNEPETPSAPPPAAAALGGAAASIGGGGAPPGASPEPKAAPEEKVAGGGGSGPRGAKLAGLDAKCPPELTKTSTHRSPQGTKRCNKQTPGSHH